MNVFGRDILLFCVALFLLMCTTNSFASNAEVKEGKTAIVVASFGTTVPEAVGAITNIVDKVKEAYPHTEVRVTFTSNIIRSIWKKRQAEPKKWLDMGIPEEILYVKNIISTMGDLREDGYSKIIVQPTHMFFMEQSHDLNMYLKGLSSIRTMKRKWQPFDVIVMGRPALGMPGNVYDYHQDVEKAVKTLEGNVKQAVREDAALVYMGHGNEHWSTGIYAETAKAINEEYPEVKAYVGVVEGSPTVEDILKSVKHSGKKKVMLVPFMIVAGDHAVNDMASDEEDSWKSVFTEAGYEVQTVLEGLGSNDAFAEIFVDHIKDAADHAGLKLK